MTDESKRFIVDQLVADLPEDERGYARAFLSHITDFTPLMMWIAALSVGKLVVMQKGWRDRVIPEQVVDYCETRKMVLAYVQTQRSPAEVKIYIETIGKNFIRHAFPETRANHQRSNPGD